MRNVRNFNVRKRHLSMQGKNIMKGQSIKVHKEKPEEIKGYDYMVLMNFNTSLLESFSFLLLFVFFFSVNLLWQFLCSFSFTQLISIIVKSIK